MVGDQPRLVRDRLAGLDHAAVFGHVLIGHVAGAEVMVGLADHRRGVTAAEHGGQRPVDHDELPADVFGIEIGVGEIIEKLAQFPGRTEAFDEAALKGGVGSGHVHIIPFRADRLQDSPRANY